MRYFTVILLIVSVLLANAQQVNFNKETFRFYTSKGKVSTYESLYNACLESDIILFGELHNNAVVHWLQLELAQDLLADSSHKLILGAEMIERHQQLAIEEYVQGVSDYKQLKSDIKLWNNFKTDYKPLVDLAKTNHLDFVGTNCP